MHTLAQLQAGALAGAVSVKLSEGLTHFPAELFKLADTLEYLDLSGNNLHYLPPDFGKLTNLRTFFCSNNAFTVLPEVLGDCPLLDIVGFKANKITTIPPRSLNANLRWLILTDNSITELPKEIGLCTRMQKLMLAGNKLSTLPAALRNCSNLGLLRISANRLVQFPHWLLSMPQLSWLALSGNPFCVAKDRPSLPFISWHELDVHHVLGEGASGIILKAIHHSGAQSNEVAVKVFKSAVTSDGLPADEMNAFIAAGTHPGLVKVIAQVSDHPHNKKGLVMELVPRQFYNLGLPPSLISCTRDVFHYDTRLSVKQVLKVASSIASVAHHLHVTGIMHGDLYAHNILVDHDGNTLLTDFGAASLYDTDDSSVAPAFERIEVCAFGHLLDDLLTLCRDEAENETLNHLKKLRDDCRLPDVLLRPGFGYLYNVLSTLLYTLGDSK